MKYTITILAATLALSSRAQNPLIRDQYSADPSARVFNGRVYIFPSHDILAEEGKGRPGWFCMEDYHVFSSSNLTDWQDHGVIVSQNTTPWVKPDSYNMWAPDCIYRNGRYYFYFPTSAADTIAFGRGFSIGVAVADKPEGPYVPQPLPIKGVKGIDPNIFIDKDGQAYLYWSQGNIFAARLKDNMLELDGEVKTLAELPAKGLKEGPYLFERNGVYYLTYPHVENRTERLEYAIGDNPLGPFKFTGVIMDESPTGCWTNHHSILSFRSQWYLFYHHNDYSPSFDKARSVRADSLFFNADGTIRKVIPTLRGIGLTKATSRIQMDRYSDRSQEGAAIAFLDTANTFNGWKVILNKPGAWVQYNSVRFERPAKEVTVRVNAPAGGKILIRSLSADKSQTTEIHIPAGSGWREIKNVVTGITPGIRHIILEAQGSETIETDWIKFE